MSRSTLSRRPPSLRQQRGAVLYIALIMLILLALIGLVAMQVAGMQERMAANYNAVNQAFQRVEGLVRNVECNIEDLENRRPHSCTDRLSAVTISYRCDDGHDSGVWVGARTLAEAPVVNVRKIDECVVGESTIAMGVGPLGESSPIMMYQISGYETDLPNQTGAPAPTTAAALDTVFKL
ncbi:PilX N-terminal domain-containing pilus assembly protein [Luteimonas sp. YGD11-2]|uniref:pilus assembly PilX family protein n=1 Tax=Luteimonas sp. YGD11-2 TaxID=2508168 RepID=UPI00100BB6AB|nr:PilX N-terminal domain-containing pilus assembly protein [Luteimonas sp. YGD11-2]